MTKTTSTRALFLVLIALATGCGRTNPDSNVALPRGELDEIYEMYQLHVKNHQRPPASLSDLKEYEPMHPTALQGVRDGKYLVVWGVNDKGGGTVLAYEKDAPSKSGLAVMADGTVKRLDAKAFQNLPKAK